MTRDITVGLDLGDRFGHFCVLDGEGRVLEEDRVRTRPEALREHRRSLRSLLHTPSKNRYTLTRIRTPDTHGLDSQRRPSSARQRYLNLPLPKRLVLETATVILASKEETVAQSAAPSPSEPKLHPALNGRPQV